MSGGKVSTSDVTEQREATKSLTPLAYLLPLRLTVGWDWLDAGLRKLMLAPAKVNPSSSSFVLNKFVSFLPHAGPFTFLLKYFLENPSVGGTFLVTYAVAEVIVGVFLITGLLSRLAGFGSVVMAAALMPAYWLGSTCEDEWQIGILLVASSVVLMLMASGRKFGLDSYLFVKFGDRPISSLPVLRWIKFW
jgi:thiosulfate dehydrogenase [quinone] large subunit